MTTAAILASWLVFGEVVPFPAQTVFENTTLTGSTQFSSFQSGSEVRLGGTAQLLTELAIGVSRQGFPGTADLEARIYLNDAAGGHPGTEIWDSGLRDDFPLVGGAELIRFPLAFLAVPDEFTWTLEISDSRGPVSAAAGLPRAFPPTVGNVVDGWFGSPGAWNQFDGKLMVSIRAVPEPSSMAIAILGSLALVAWAWRRRRGCGSKCGADC